MPMVFVHGVANRPNAAWDAAKKRRDDYFRRITLDKLIDIADANAVRFPMWGGNAASLAFDGASIPTDKDGDRVALGTDDHVLSEVLLDIAPLGLKDTTHGILRAVTETAGLESAVDLLLAASMQAAADAVASVEVAAGAAEALAYAREHPTPPWLVQVRDDEDFAAKLDDAVRRQRPTAAGDAVVALGPPGFRDRLAEGADRLRGGLTDGVLTKALKSIRVALTQKIVEFFGDVFVYTNERGDRTRIGAIPSIVLRDLRDARADADRLNEPLIVVGHSMGGNIVYDLLTHFDTTLKVDAFVTVGSQTALFEEMKLFRGSDKSITAAAGRTVPKPPNVRHWINVFDMSDPFSFVLGRVFSDVTDFPYDSDASPLSAHGAYFERPSFYWRLHERLKPLLAAN